MKLDLGDGSWMGILGHRGSIRQLHSCTGGIGKIFLGGTAGAADQMQQISEFPPALLLAGGWGVPYCGYAFWQLGSLTH